MRTRTDLPAPRAERRPHVTEIHGVRLEDPYYWLRERNSEVVRAHLEAENAHTEAKSAHLDGLRRELFTELLGRIQEDDRTVPAKDGPFEYYRRTQTGQAYGIYCRRPVGGTDAQETVVIDVNRLAEGHAYTSPGAYEMSPDHRTVAYSMDHAGGERHALVFEDVDTRQRYPECIANTSEDVAWASDSQTVFYVTVDDQVRPHRVYRHRLGTPVSEDVLVFEERDESFFVGLARTRSGGQILIGSHSGGTSEIWMVDAARPEDEFAVIRPRIHDVEYDVDHLGDRIYIRTNQDAFFFRLESVPLADLQAVPRVEIEAREGITLEGFDLFSNHLVWWGRKDGLTEIWVRRFADGDIHRLQFEDPAYVVWEGANYETDTTVLRIEYTSMVRPSTVYDYDLDARTLTERRQLPVPGYDAARYVTERIWADAPDGARIPISVVRARTTPLDGSAPLLLEGYGAYGEVLEPCFDRDLVSLLDRGFVAALAHVRGGGEMGRPWRRGGQLANKPNSFSDFIICVEHLLARGYGAPGRVALEGRSAGGLLVGAVINQRPDMFRAGIAGVPFVDVTQTLLDDQIPLTVVEWEEWGNPKDPEAFAVIHGYSPYDNVASAAYPDLLVTAGLNDPRVQYWEPTKWVQRLRDANRQPEGVILLKVDLGAGHLGQSGRYGAIEDRAFEFAFLLDRMGMLEGQTAPRELTGALAASSADG